MYITDKMMGHSQKSFLINRRYFSRFSLFLLLLLLSSHAYAQKASILDTTGIVNGERINTSFSINKLYKSSNNQRAEVFYDFDATGPETYYTYTSGSYDGTTVSSDTWVFDQSSETYENSVSLRSGDISHNESSNVSFLVNISSSGGTLQFKYRTSTESDYDWLKIDINDNRLDSFSGGNSWQNSQVYDLPPGEYYIDFWYTKDGSQSSGLDAVFVDDIVITGLTDETPTNPEPETGISDFLNGNTVISYTDNIEIEFYQDISEINNFESQMLSSIEIFNNMGDIFHPSSVSVNGRTLTIYQNSLLAADTLNLVIDSDEFYYESPVFYTTYIGDFTQDHRVNFDDLVIFSDGWRTQDFQYETAPLVYGYYGFPQARLTGNNNYNIDDLVNFIRFWNVSKARNKNTKKESLAKYSYSNDLEYIDYTLINQSVTNSKSEEMYNFTISHSDSLKALSFIIDYDPLEVQIDKISNLELFDTDESNSTIFLSHIDSLNGIATIDIANYKQLQSLHEKDAFSITFSSLDNSESEITIASEMRFSNNEKLSQATSKRLTFDYELPQLISLNQNYPNPFNPTTTIDYALPEQAEVSIEIYDIVGRKIETLFSRQNQNAGRHEVVWNASNFASGMYFYVLNVHTNSGNNVSFTKKMMLIK